MLRSLILLFFALNCGLTLAQTPFVRLIIYGGAREVRSDGSPHELGKTHNETFGNAAFRLKKEYLLKQDAVVKVVKIETGDELVHILNKQKENSILSLDFLTHGDFASLNMSYKEGTNCGLYTNQKSKKIIEKIHQKGYHFVAESRSVDAIKFNRFNTATIIEFHSCKSANNPCFQKSIAKYFSQKLQEAQKTESYVIGHIHKSEPNQSNSSKSTTEYRNGKRAIYYQGKVWRKTRKEGSLHEWILHQITTENQKSASNK